MSGLSIDVYSHNCERVSISPHQRHIYKCSSPTTYIQGRGKRGLPVITYILSGFWAYVSGLYQYSGIEATRGKI